MPDADEYGRSETALALRPEDRTGLTNPLYPGADPWVIRHGPWYYLCQAEAGGVRVWKSPTLLERGQRQSVWNAPAHGWNRSQLWAPELHWLRGKWYIYYAASAGWNASHRMGVLEALSDDPQGQYVDRGMLYTGDDIQRQTDSRWAIDGTVMELRGQLYFLWSGWEGERDVQHLYIAPMANPWTICGNRVRLCENDTHSWERVGESRHERGLNEAPQVLIRNGRVFIVYSCSGSWQASYKMGMLSMADGCDPMAPASWRKHPEPVFQPTCEVFGVGHCCFTTSPDGTEDWMVYHAKRHRREGWERVVRAQPFTWSSDGRPDFGEPVGPRKVLVRPSNRTRVEDRAA